MRGNSFGYNQTVEILIQKSDDNPFFLGGGMDKAAVSDIDPGMGYG